MSHKVLITGAGGPAAISFMKAVEGSDVEVHAADMDRFAAGLYLVPESRRILLPAGAHPDLVPALLDECLARQINVLVPTVDSELLPVATAEADFEFTGTRVLVATAPTLSLCLDKLRLVRAVRDLVPCPRSEAFDDAFSPTDWEFPVIVKPRRGSGSRGIHLVQTKAELDAMKRDANLLVQEYLPGDEYSVDVLAGSDGIVAAAVPRIRMKIDSGVAVAARTVKDDELEELAKRMARAIGLRYVANVQFRRDVRGAPKLLEVNARFPGTMPLTVAAGVNMPMLALANCLGTPIPDGCGQFRELGVVRYLEERLVQPEEFDRLPGQVGRTATAAE